MSRLAAAAISVSVAVALAAAPPGAASAAAPDVAFRTPVAHTSAATARSAIAIGGLRRRLAKLMRRAGRASGAWVGDASGNTLFARRGGKRRRLASNMKLYTTSTAVARFGPEGRLQTTAWGIGTLSNGVLTGNLALRGDGDPTLDARDLDALAARVSAAGITQVTGATIYDESAFDAIRSVPMTGVRSSLGGTLSGLMYPGGAKSAATEFVAALRERGIVMPKDVKQGQVATDQPGQAQIAAVDSPPMSELIKLTNVPSNNFLAETLVKNVGSHFGQAGSTAAGLDVVRNFSTGHVASVNAENGSGLSVLDRASPRSVGNLLAAMLRQSDPVADAFTGSLAVAGQSGTLLRRMRGTAAAGRCHAKTGTLNGVSALSGYCFRAGLPSTVFSLLMNRTDITRAHFVQDKIAATVARYRP